MLISIFALPAANAEQVTVARDKRKFTVHIVMDVDAPLENAREVLSDFRGYARLHHAITESWEEKPEKGYLTRMYTRIKGCVWFFCKKLKWSGDVSVVSEGHWRAVAVKTNKSISTGDSYWGVREGSSGTEFFFDSSFSVSFWVPPLIGSWLVKRKLTNEMTEFVENLERLANDENNEKKKN